MNFVFVRVNSLLPGATWRMSNGFSLPCFCLALSAFLLQLLFLFILRSRLPPPTTHSTDYPLSIPCPQSHMHGFYPKLYKVHIHLHPDISVLRRRGFCFWCCCWYYCLPLSCIVKLVCLNWILCSVLLKEKKPDFSHKSCGYKNKELNCCSISDDKKGSTSTRFKEWSKS